jgi:hypothetical protein
MFNIWDICPRTKKYLSSAVCGESNKTEKHFARVANHRRCRCHVNKRTNGYRDVFVQSGGRLPPTRRSDESLRGPLSPPDGTSRLRLTRTKISGVFVGVKTMFSISPDNLSIVCADEISRTLRLMHDDTSLDKIQPKQVCYFETGIN